MPADAPGAAHRHQPHRDEPRAPQPRRVAAGTSARVAVVMASLAIVTHRFLGGGDVVMFSAFGAFALLGLADFRGTLPSRFVASLWFGVVGSLLIVVGTAASSHLVASVALMLVAGFVILYLRVLGGRIAAASRGMLLALLLSLMLPGGVDATLDRVGGWLLAAVVGGVAAVVLWPAHERSAIRAELARIAAQLAELLGDVTSLTDAELDPVRRRITELRERVDAMLTRPGGPRARDRALLYLLDESGRCVMFLGEVIERGRDGAHLADDDLEGLARGADVLAATGQLLRGVPTPVPVEELMAVRAHQLDQVDTVLDATDVDLDAGADRSALVDRFDVLFPVRMLTYLALSMSANAQVATGSAPAEVSFEYQPESPALRHDLRAAAHRLVATLRDACTPRSRWFRNAVRAAVALSVAVAVADITHLDRGLWVVLGTLAALRSSVADTGVSVLQAVGGTFAGFLVAAGVLFLVDQEHLWMLLPFAVFAASYTATAVGNTIGQAAFTVMSVVLLSLAEPVGWSIGLVRVERVALGVTVAIVAAALLWPRGAAHDLAVAVRVQLDAASAYLRQGLRSVLVGTDPAEDRRRLQDALAARQVADGELGNLMTSRDAQQVAVDTWALLVARPHALLLGGSALVASARRQDGPAVAASPSRPAAGDATLRRAVTALEQLTDELHVGRGADPGAAERFTAERFTAARRDLVDVLDTAGSRAWLSDQQLIGLLWCEQWLRFAHHLDATLAAPLAEVHAELERSWWR